MMLALLIVTLALFNVKLVKVMNKIAIIIVYFVFHLDKTIHHIVIVQVVLPLMLKEIV
jgi:hypothetical protein